MSKELTDSARVYLFCVGYCEYFNRNLTVNLEDLSSIGLVADRANFANDVGIYY